MAIGQTRVDCRRRRDGRPLVAASIIGKIRISDGAGASQRRRAALVQRAGSATTAPASSARSATGAHAAAAVVASPCRVALVDARIELDAQGRVLVDADGVPIGDGRGGNYQLSFALRRGPGAARG
jgi:hypothetical protein